jgi:hypothetical protein
MYICQGEKCKGKKINWCEGMRGIKGGQAERAKARSKTFPGIAKAMAEQWGTERAASMPQEVAKKIILKVWKHILQHRRYAMRITLWSL